MCGVDRKAVNFTGNKQTYSHRHSALYITTDFALQIMTSLLFTFQCSDTVGLVTVRAFGLKKSWVLVCWWRWFDWSSARHSSIQWRSWTTSGKWSQGSCASLEFKASLDKSLNFIKLKQSLNCFGKRVEGLEKFGICLCETFNKTWWLRTSCHSCY